MDEELKAAIVASVILQLPTANEDRLKSILTLIELEVETYNECDKQINWEKLQGVVTEVLYQSMKIELDKSVTSVRRGDTTIGYSTNSAQIQYLLVGYKELIRRVIGCGGVTFW